VRCLHTPVTINAFEMCEIRRKRKMFVEITKDLRRMFWNWRFICCNHLHVAKLLAS
jgi:hypothetical protein